MPHLAAVDQPLWPIVADRRRELAGEPARSATSLAVSPLLQRIADARGLAGTKMK